MAAWERSPTCRNAKSTRLVCASFQQSLNLPLHLRKRGRQRAQTRVDDDLPSEAYVRSIFQVQLATYRFAHAPFDAVSNHSATKCARTGEADPNRALFVISQAEGGK